PAPRAREAGVDDALLRAVVGLVRRLAEPREPLEAARLALESEIRKRLLAEEQLARSIFALQDEALHDALTGLYNRRYLDASLEREESRARRSGQTMAVIMIDVDHFKHFNDAFGHAAGDAVLREVGKFIASLARREDIAARYGGDEFTLVLAQTSLDTALLRARTLGAGAQTLGIEFDGRALGPVALSVGVAAFPEHGSSMRQVLEVADAALRRCKQSGRGGIALAEKSA
ncbi:MAG: GGDEF domain-containing protein, partial [Burkholderiales bacterium]